MNWNVAFFVNSILLGVGLAMDAFSVSLANGLNEPKMKTGRICTIAGVFALFQALMPMIGWGCVQTIVQYLKVFEKMIPWIALVLLAFIGGKMLMEGLGSNESADDEDNDSVTIGFWGLIIQGIATSIDALSVGFTISDYNFLMALVCAGLISVVTFFICVCGILIGRKFGTKLAGKASILGGGILIFIGLQIFNYSNPSVCLLKNSMSIYILLPSVMSFYYLQSSCLFFLFTIDAIIAYILLASSLQHSD